MCKVSVKLGRKVCEHGAASLSHLFTLPCAENQKNEGRKGQREEMKEVSLGVSLAFSAAPGKAFAIQRSLIQTKRQTTSQASSFLSPKRCCHRCVSRTVGVLILGNK